VKSFFRTRIKKIKQRKRAEENTGEESRGREQRKRAEEESRGKRRGREQRKSNPKKLIYIYFLTYDRNNI